MNLRHIAVGVCSREKFAIASLHKHVQHGVVKGWIRRMTVRLPTAIQKVDLDAAANRISTVDSYRSIVKVRPSFPIPRAELDNVDFIAGGAGKMFSEFSGEPASLELQFRWDSRGDEERTLTNATGIA